MHRSASWNRFSDDYFKHAAASAISSSSSSSSSSSHHHHHHHHHHSPHRSYSMFDGSNLPKYDPIVELAKKERARVKFAENAVHVIPFVLLACAIILWIFSNADMGIMGDPIGTRIEGLSIEGEIESDSDGTQTGFLPIVNKDDLSTKEFGDSTNKVSINLKNF